MQHGAALVELHYQELKAWNALQRKLLTDKRVQAGIEAKASSSMLKYVSD
jgi:hypothetical protein